MADDFGGGAPAGGDGPHGAHLPKFLTKKYGPLSGWAWGIIAAVGVGLVMYLRARSAASSGAAAAASPVGTPVGSGATGFTEDQLGQLQGLVNGSVTQALAGSAGSGSSSASGAATNPLSSYVNSEYTNLLGRSGEQQGVSYWTNQLLGGQTTQQQFTAFESTPEAQAYAASNPTGFVTGQYETLLNRQPDQAGLTYWTQQLAQNNASAESVQFLQAAQPELGANAKA